MSESMSEIIAGLLLFIQSQLGLFNPIEPPHIEFLQAVEIAEIACEQQCGDVKGWTPALSDTVYLNQDLRITQDIFDRSIILHELVHYVQYKYQLTNMPTDCLTWKAREAQAYQMQFLWLHEHHITSNWQGLHSAMQRIQYLQCPAADETVASL